jgi:hypothetical protein
VSEYSGPARYDRNTATEYFGSIGVAHGLLRRRHSGKAMSFPSDCPLILTPFFSLHSSLSSDGQPVAAKKLKDLCFGP